MFRIKVVRKLNAPIDKVFEVLVDHENYDKFPMIDRASLLREGREEKNGKGAFRTVRMGKFQVWESIRAFDRPTKMNYKIQAAAPFKMKHHKGEIDLQDLGGLQTEVTWVSEGEIVVPVVGRLIDSMMEKGGTRIFHSMLKDIERRVGAVE